MSRALPALDAAAITGALDRHGPLTPAGLRWTTRGAGVPTWRLLRAFVGLVIAGRIELAHDDEGELVLALTDPEETP